MLHILRAKFFVVNPHFFVVEYMKGLFLTMKGKEIGYCLKYGNTFERKNLFLVEYYQMGVSRVI